MDSRRAYLAGLGVVATASFTGCSGSGTPATDGGSGTTDGGSETTGGPKRVDPTSTAFADGDRIPTRYTCDGAGASPPLAVDAPDRAATWAVVVTDPDAPGGTFTHWLVWNIPVRTDLPEGVPHGKTVPSLQGANQGKNGFGENGYGGMCPPAGDGAHTYRFSAYTLDGRLDVGADVDRPSLVDAIDANDPLSVGSIAATFSRTA